ncbi:hypothetical protein ACQJBY_066145 [Aegilops geniculata]
MQLPSPAANHCFSPMRESPRISGSQPRRRPPLTTASHRRGRTTPLPRARVSAATAGDEADHLLVLPSAASFDGGVASVHAGATTSVFGSCKDFCWNLR